MSVRYVDLDAVRDAGGEEMEVEFRHNCWKHDQDLLIRYAGVSSFVIDLADEGREVHLGAVTLDEILPHRDGGSHEFACWGGTLAVVCRDLRAAWNEATCSSWL
ncbi:hypothetical protein [Streptomyces sp. SS1-1]|uniref:hypothetical protein n=1 Tax=Streptomyces sp. SS1-1 TaxID=2651869 RepID=UPI00178C3B3E|nr:hypothetical protein [Streptomyces sp. SS1-1]